MSFQLIIFYQNQFDLVNLKNNQIKVLQGLQQSFINLMIKTKELLTERKLQIAKDILRKDEYGISHSQGYDQYQNQKIPILDIFSKQTTKVVSNKKLPTVRKLLEALNSKNNLQKSSSFIQTQRSQKQIQSFSNNKGINKRSVSKMKTISRLLLLKHQQIQKIKEQNMQDKQMQTKRAIFQIIDQIHNSKNFNAFYSKPHFSATQQSKQKKHKLQKTISKYKINQQESFKDLTYKESSKTLQIKSNRQDKINKKQQYHRIADQIDKIKTHEGYFSVIRQMNAMKKVQPNKKSVYHTIDPNKTQKFFHQANNSPKKLSKLIHQKNNLQSQKTKQKQRQYKNNQTVGRLLSQSRQKFQKNQFEISQMCKSRQKSKTLIVSNKNIFKLQDYKVKCRKYFQINSSQKSKLNYSDRSQQNSTRKKQDFIEILPQIRAYSKYKI